MILVHFQGKPFNVIVIQVYAPTTDAEGRCWLLLWRFTRLARTSTKKDVLFITENVNSKVGNKKIHGVTGKFGLGVQNVAKWRANANSFVKRTHWSKQTFFSTQEKTTHGHYQMVNTEIRWIIFFAAKDEEALYSQQKWGLDLTVSQIMSSLLKKSGLSWRK